MPGLSMYHSATGAQSPHCIHAIGIGKTGAQMVEALMRTGEIEDMLEDPRARFTALAVDIGERGPARAVREYCRRLQQPPRGAGDPDRPRADPHRGLPVPSRTS